VAPCLADHDGELALIVKVVADLRLHQRLLMADLAAGKARKQRRLFGDGAADLGNVVAVVESDADDFAGIGNDRSKRNLVEGMVGMRGCHEPRRIGQPVRFKQLAQRRAAFDRKARAEIDDAMVLESTVAGAAVDNERE
jgi:hypothetical protein